MGFPPPTDRHGFDALYGLELDEVGEELARGRVQIRDEHRQADPGLGAERGPVHSGVYAAVADTLAVRGTVAGISDQRAVGLATHTHVLHPIGDGAMHATALRRHRGRTTWVWEVEIADDAGRVCVVARVTVGVRDP
jgi:1,4-dihydroxy-2-naphthoyl-CoA hydrolase